MAEKDVFSTEKPKKSSMKWIIALLLVIIGIVLLSGIMLYSWIDYVKPYEYACINRPIGFWIFEKGWVDKVYSGEFVIVLPFENLHRLPKDLVEMDYHKKGIAALDAPKLRNYNLLSSIKIKPSDGDEVYADVSLFIRIIRPYDTLTKVGIGDLYLKNVVFPQSEPIIQEIMGHLTVEQLYDVDLVEKKEDETVAALDEKWSEYGIAVDTLDLRYLDFKDDIQEGIEKKNLERQKKRHEAEKKKLADALAKLRKLEIKGKADVKALGADADRQVREALADLDLYKETNHIDGDKLVEVATQESNRLRNNAYFGPGSEIMMQWEAVQVLGCLKGVLTSGYDPLQNVDLELNIDTNNPDYDVESLSFNDPNNNQ